jgi:uncharacterized protein involved in outer membrane biogenesis
MKWIKWIVLGVLVLLIGTALAVWLNLNSIVRRTVQSQTQASLNLETSVGGANVSLLGGSLGLSNVQIGSPKGFAAPRMFTLGGTSVDVSYGELRKDPIRIDQIVIDRPNLVVEQKDGKFNFKVLMDQQSSQPSDGEPIKLIIGRLDVKDAQVALRPGIPGLGQEIAIPIPSFTLSNVGSGEGAENGAAIKQVVMLMVTTMASKAAESDKLPRELQLLLKGNVEELARDIARQYGDKAIAELKKQLPGDVGNVVGGVLDAAKSGKDPGKAVEEGLKGLLDPKKEKPTTRSR